MSPRRYKITVDGTSHDVEMGYVSESPVRVNVDGVDYDVEVPGKPVRGATPARPSAPARPISQPSASASPTTPTHSTGANSMTAVMPGRVLSVAVSIGDSVNRGDLVCVIEAMKMEQQIGANRDGVISAVHISGGDSVAHGQILVEFE